MTKDKKSLSYHKWLENLQVPRTQYTGCIKKVDKCSLFREAPQCMKFFIKIDCFGTYNVELTEKMRNLNFSTQWGGGGVVVVSFTTS